MQTEQAAMKKDQLETYANPPPPVERKRDEPHLFQTMDDMRLRHGNSAGRGERLLHTAGAVLACVVLAGLLYMAILFTE
jgi:hypothetical protein